MMNGGSGTTMTPSIIMKPMGTISDACLLTHCTHAGAPSCCGPSAMGYQ